MLKSLSKLSRSASGSKLTRSNSGARLMKPNSNSGLDDTPEDEKGHWHYLVVDAAGIRPRRETTYSKDSKDDAAPRIKEGSIVEICARRKTSWTQWLCLASGVGWVHDVSPKDYAVRMVEVEVLKGDWVYQVGGHKVSILQWPSLCAAQHPPKGASSVEANEVLKVCERIRPLNGKGCFLRLADFRGWVFDFSKGDQVIQRYRGSPREDCESDLCCSASTSLSTTCSTSEEEPELSALRKGPHALQAGPSEHGSWDYIVLEPKGISLRTSPTFDASAKNGSRLAHGDIVKALERQTCDGTTFLRFEFPPGWAFDLHQRLTNQRKRMAPVEVEHGEWHYRVCTTKGVALRKRCSLDDASKIGRGPAQGALLTVIRRVKLGEITFCRLKDQNAWVPDCKDGRVLLEGPIELQAHSCPATVKSADGVHLMDAPTWNKWARTKKVLLKGSVAQVVCTCILDGEEWVQVSQPGGMEGWSSTYNFDMRRSAPILAAGSGCNRDLIQKALWAQSPLAVA